MQIMHIRNYIYVIALTLNVLLTSCGSMGPKSMRAGRMEYNKALGQSSSEQLLLNIVKMRFLDRPVFLNVTSMTSNLSFESELSTTTADVFKSTQFATTINPTLTWKDNPTITYQELTGVEYVVQMLSPISSDTIVLLLQSWPADMVLPIAVKEINSINNNWNPFSPNLNAGAIIEHKRFNDVAKVIQSLTHQRILEWSVARKVGASVGTVEAAILLNRPNDSKTTELIQTFLSDLGLQKAKEGSTRFSVEYGLEKKDSNTIVFGTRSMQDILSFASMDVDIPDHMQDLVMPMNISWGDQELPKLLQIKSSSSRPENVAVAIPYRGEWFYISSDDLQSKAAFLLIQVLMDMQSGATTSGTPVLTIPVSS